MNKQFKYLLSITLALMMFSSHHVMGVGPAYETQGNNWKFINDTAPYGSNHTGAEQPFGEGTGLVASESQDLHVLVKDQSYIKWATSDQFTRNNNHTTPTPIIDNVKSVWGNASGSQENLFVGVILVTNNNPLGFKLKIKESSGDTSLNRYVWNASGGGDWTQQASWDSSATGIAEKGNEIEYTMTLDHLTTNIDTNSITYAYGVFSDVGGSVHYVHDDIAGNGVDSGGLKITEIGDHQNNESTLDFTALNGARYVYHATFNFPIEINVKFNTDIRNLRGLYKETITVTIQDGF